MPLAIRRRSLADEAWLSHSGFPPLQKSSHCLIPESRGVM
jgi:hypothetical protein